MKEAVEKQQQPGPASVHHPGRPQRGQLLRGPLERPGSGLTGALEHFDKHVGATMAGFPRGLPGFQSGWSGSPGGGPGDRKDGPFHRVADGGVGAVTGPGESLGHIDRPDGLHRAERPGQAAQDLGQDDTGVAAGTHERAMAETERQALHVERAAEGVDLLLDRFQRQGHVGPGVAVGHRVDVEAVEGGPVRYQRVAVGADDAGQVDGRQALRCREIVCYSHGGGPCLCGSSWWCLGTTTGATTGAATVVRVPARYKRAEDGILTLPWQRFVKFVASTRPSA